MNKIYRLVWNETTRTMAAVAEIAKGRGKSSSGSGGSTQKACISLIKPLALALSVISVAYAAPPLPTQLPTGGKIVAGTAGIAQSGATLNITQSTQRAAIDWQTFNLGSQAQVNFLQPSSSSATLNRVLDSNPSQIYGHISANGQVFLTNPNGAYFSPSASVDVGSFMATTHGISDTDFMAGNYKFSRDGATGSIVNDGNLKASLGGYIALLAPEVRNNGVIVAQMGTVALAAGEEYELQFDGNNALSNIRVTPSAIAALVENGNAVQVPGGLIILSAQAADRLQGGVVNNSGALEAGSLSAKGGRILLGADTINLKSGSRLDATGATGGGEVLVGGGWQGSGTSQPATKVTQEAGASIDASATKIGDGGTIVLWSDVKNIDSVTMVQGSLKAEGGSAGGNGGQIETSGHHLNVSGIQVSTRAPQGKSGTWLLDPDGFTIATSGGDIDGATLGSNINTNGDTIIHSSDGSGSDGNININDNVSWSAHNLTLIATNGVTGSGNLAAGGVLTINQGGTTSYSGAISGTGASLVKDGAGTLTLNGVNTYTGNTTVSAGTMTIGSSGMLGGGDYSGALSVASGATFNYSSDASQIFRNLATGASDGTINLNGTGSNTVTLSGHQDYTGILNIAQNVEISGASNSSDGGVGHASAININNHGYVTLAGEDNSFVGGSAVPPITIYTGGTLYHSNGSSFHLGSLTLAGGEIASNGSINTSYGNFNLDKKVVVTENSILSAQGVITTQGGGTIFDVADNKTLTVSGGLYKANYQSDSGLIKAGSGTMLLTGSNSYTGDTTVSAGTLTIGGSGVLGSGAYTGALSVAPAATFNFSSSTDQSFSNLAAGTGTINFNGSGTVTLPGNNAFNGTLNVAQTVDMTVSTDVPGAIEGLGYTSALNIQSGGTINLKGTHNTFLGNNVAVTPVTDLTIDTGGTLNDYSGMSYNVRTHSLTLNGGTITSIYPLATGYGSFAFYGPINVIKDSTISATKFQANGAMTIADSKTLTLSGDLGGSGSLSLAGSNSLLLATGSINRNLDINITGPGHIEKQGSNIFTVTGNNDYTGGTAINGGELEVGSTGALGNSSIISFGGGALRYSSANTTDYSARFSTAVNQAYAIDTNEQTVSYATDLVIVSDSLTKLGGGTLILTGANTYTGGTAINGGLLELGSAETSGHGPLGSGSISFGGGTLRHTAINTTDYSNRFSSANHQLFSIDTNGQDVSYTTALVSTGGSLSKLGSGTLTLTGANSYTSDTSVMGGTLTLGGASVLGNGNYSGALSVASGAIFNLVSSADQTFTNLASDGGAINNGLGIINLNGSGTIAINGNQSFNGILNIAQTVNQLVDHDPTQEVSYGGGIGWSKAVNINSGGTLNITGDHNSLFGGYGSVLLTINSGGELHNSSGNSYNINGAITLNGGTISAVDATSGYGTFGIHGGITVGDSSFISAPSVSINSAVSIAAGKTLSVNSSNISGDISGDGSLIKAWAGTLNLSGNNTYTGGTRINAGILALGSSGALGTAGTISFGGGTLQYSSSNATDYSDRFSSANNQLYSIDTNGQNVSYANNLVSSGGSLTKLGDGTLVLTGANTYDSATAINGGVLELGSLGAIGSSGTISFGGGTLRHSSSNLTDYSGRFSTADNQAYSIDTNGQDVSYVTGLTSFGGSLVKLGTGILTLTGSSTYTGDTTISAGTLQLGGATGTLATSGITNNGTLSYNLNADTTVPYTISGSGSVQIKGQTGPNPQTAYARFLTAQPQTVASNISVADFLASLSGGRVSGGYIGAGNSSIQGGVYQRSYNVVDNTATLQVQILDGGYIKGVFVKLQQSGSNVQALVTGAAYNGSGSLGQDLALANSGSLAFSMTDGGYGVDRLSVNVNKAASIVFTANNSYSGGTTVNTGILQVGDGNATNPQAGTGTITVNNNAALKFYVDGGNSNFNIAQALAGTGTVTLLGEDRGPSHWSYQLSGGNDSFAGNMVIDSYARLAFNGGSELPSTVPITVNSGGQLYAKNSFANPLSLAGDGWLDSAPYNSLGALRLDGGPTLSGPVTLTGNARIGGFNDSGTISGDITGSGSLIVGSTCTNGCTVSLALTGNNSYTGGTALNAGSVVELGSAAALGNSGIISFGGGTLRHTSNNTVDYSSRFSTADNQLFSIDTHSQEVLYATGLSSTGGSLTKLGDGKLTLTGTSTYDQYTAVKAGTLEIGSNGTLNSNAALAVFGGASFDWKSSADQTLNTVAAGFYGDSSPTDGTINLQGSAGTVTLPGLQGFTGTWNIAQNVDVTGLSGDQSDSGLCYASNINIKSGGTVNIGSDYDTFLGWGGHPVNITIEAGGKLNNAGGWSEEINAGSFTLNGGTIASTEDIKNPYWGSYILVSPLTVSASSLISAPNVNLWGAAITIADGKTLSLSGDLWNWGGATVSLAGSDSKLLLTGSIDRTLDVPVDGLGSLEKQGTNTFTLTAGNTYYGRTTVSQGTLAMTNGWYGDNGSLDNTASVSIASGGLLKYNRSADFSFGADISGAGNLEQAGSGTLRLTGNNTYTGSTAINNGVLELGSLDVIVSGSVISGPIGVGGVISFGGGTLRHGTGNTTDYSDRFSNAASQSYSIDTNGQDVSYASALTSTGGTLSKSGSGTLTLTGTDSYTGSTAVNLGTLQIGDGGTTGSIDDTASVSVASGALLKFNHSNNHNVGVNISGDGSFDKDGTGTLILSGTNSYTGGTTLHAGELELGSSSAIGSTGTISFAGGSLRHSSSNTTDYSDRFSNAASKTYSIDTNGQNVTYASDLSSSGGTLSKLGTGTLTLTGTDSYSGNTTVTAGTLQIGAGGTTGSIDGTASVSLDSGATLKYNHSDDLSFNKALSGAGNFEQAGAGKLTLSGNQIYTGTTKVSAGTLNVTGTLSDLTAVTVDSSATYAVGNTDTIGSLAGAGNVTLGTGFILSSGALNTSTTYSGAMSGDGSFEKLGSGALSFTGNNSYTGGTLLTAGALELGSSGALGSTGTISFAGGKLRHTSSNTTDYSDRFSNAASQSYSIDTNGQNVTYASALTSTGGTLSKSGTGTLTLTGTDSYTGSTAVNLGTLQIGDGGTTGSIDDTASVSVASGALLKFNHSNNHNFSVNISGDGNFDKDGTGTLILSGTNSYTGGTTLHAGELELGSSSAIGSTGTISFAGGSLRHSSSNTTDYSDRFSNAASQTYSIDTNGQNVTYASDLSSSGGTLSKLGAGTLILSGANSYTGGTTLHAGELELGSTGAIGSTGTISFVGGSLRYSSSSTTDYSDRFSNVASQAYSIDTNGQNVTYASELSSAGGTLRKSGAGRLTLTGTDSYSGNTTVNEGILQIGAGGITGSIADTASVSVASGSTLKFNRSDDLSFDKIISGAGNFEQAGAGKLTLSGSQIYTGTTKISSGTLNVIGTLSDLTAVTVDGGATYAVGNADTIGSLAGAGNVTLGNGFTLSTGALNTSTTYSGAMSDDGSFEKLGNGVQSFTGNNSYTGGTTLTNGTLELGSSGALGSAGTISFAGGILRHTSNNTTDYSARFSNAASQLYNIDTNGQTVSYVSALISSGGTLNKSGTGTLTLTGNNTYTGITTVNAGTLAIGDGGISGSIDDTASVSVASGAALKFNHSDDRSFAKVISGDGSFEKYGSDKLTLTGNNTYTGITTVNTGTLAIGDGGTTGGIDDTASVSVASGATLKFNHSDDRSFAKDISGDGSVEKAGSDKLTLTGNNTHTGTTSISAGTLEIGDGGTTGSIDSTASISVASGATLKFNHSDDRSFTKDISGDGNVEKAGSDRLTLTGTNTHTGNTIVSAGILQIGDGTTTGSIDDTASVSVANGATLRFDHSDDRSFAKDISGDGSVEKTGSDKLTLTGTNTYTGITSISTGTLQLGDGGMTGSIDDTASVSVASGAILKFNHSDNRSFTKDINGDGSIEKAGSDRLTLTGINTYTGGTTINQGELEVGSAGAIGSSGDIRFSGGTLRYTAQNTTDYSDRFSSDASQAYSIDTNGQEVNYASALTSSGGTLTKSGTGKLTLSGADTYTGETTVNAGTLTINNPTALGGIEAGTTVISGATLDLKNVSVGAEAITLNGGTLMTSTGNSSLAGNVTLGNASVFNIATNATLNVTGAVTAVGKSLLISGGGNLTLDNTSNALDGGVSVSSVNNLVLINASAMTMNGIAATGTINVATLTGNLTIAGNVTTTDTSDKAITLNAGQDTAAGTSTGGDIILSGSPSFSTGNNGRTTLYTGSVSGSTGLTELVSSGSGCFRYDSDETEKNYTAELSSGSYAIYRERPTITVTANDASFTYSGSSYAGGNGVVYSGLKNGDSSSILTGSLTYTGNSQGAKNAGTYAITPTGLANGLGYHLVNADGTLTIDKATAAVVAARTYDSTTNLAIADFTISGVNGETLSLGGSGTATAASKDVASNATNYITNFNSLVLANGSGGSAGLANNYKFPDLSKSANNSATFSKATLTTTGATAQNKTYDATNAATISGETLVGILLSDSVTVSGGGTFADKNAADGKSVTAALTLGSTDAGNYTLIQPDGLTANISKATLTVTADSQARLYGQVNPTFSETITGFFSNENVSVVNGVGFGSTTAVASTGVGNVTINASNLGLSARNYDFTNLVDGTLTINKAHLTVTADNQSRLYGQSNPDFTETISGFVNGENASNSNVSGTARGSSSANTASGVGTITITASAGTLTADNYDFPNLINGVLTILPEPVITPIAVQILPVPSTPIAGLNTVGTNVANTTNTSTIITTNIDSSNSSNTGTNNTSTSNTSTSNTSTNNTTTNNTSTNNTSTSTSNTSNTSTSNTSTIDTTTNNTSTNNTSTNNTSTTDTTTNTTNTTVSTNNTTPSSTGGTSSGNVISTAATDSSRTNGISVSLTREPTVQQTGVVTVSVPKEMATSGAGFSFPLPAQVTQTSANVSSTAQVTLISGQPLPSWIKFNAETKTFVASAVPDGAFPMQVMVTIDGNRSIVVISERTE